MAKRNSIGEAIAQTLGDDVSRIDTSVQLIPWTKIKPNPRNFYPIPEPDALAELASSIAVNGLLEPLAVIKNGVMDEYRLISGHSRWRAINLPVVKFVRRDLYMGVPCVVLPVTPTCDQEMCLIIEANRQRVKSAALLAEEAEKLAAAYASRKNAGEQMPGRIRDRVAESLKVSASKLAMAEATKKNLTLPGFAEQWRGGQIPDTVAYEISKMQGDHQYRLLDWCINNGRPAGSLKVAEVKALEAQFNARARKWDMPREKEDALFLAAAEKVLTEHLRFDLADCGTRSDAIKELAKCNRASGGGGDDWDYACDAKGVTVRNGKAGAAPKITRSWAEVYDALCIAALRKLMEAKRGG